MKSITFLIIVTIMTSCAVIQEPIIYENQSPLTFNLKDEINKEIFEGFYDSDSTKIPKNAYFLK